MEEPATNKVTMRCIFVAIIALNVTECLIDVKDAFLHGNFEPEEKMINVEIPDGLKERCEIRMVILLFKTIYSLKQSVMVFCKNLKTAMKWMNVKRSLANPCLHCAQRNSSLAMRDLTVRDSTVREYNLIIFLICICNCICIGIGSNVMIAKE